MIKLAKTSFYNEKEIRKKLAGFILKADVLSMGRECRKFEENFAKKQKRKHAVFASSGSSANLVLIQSLLNLGKFKKGDKIGFSALTWSTNVMPLIQLGLIPVALDCNLETLNVFPEEIENNISKIKGLLLTNTLGFSDDIKRIKNICEKKGTIFLEDNCESLGSKSSGKLLGNFGKASTFSFFVGHHLSVIEGGMICTDDEKLYNMLIMVRAHGWDRNLNEQTQTKLREKHQIDNFYAKYTFYDLAYNARPTEVNGFLGNIQIDFWDEIISKRAENFKIFNKKIKNNDDFLPLELTHMNLISNFAMPVVCRNKEIFEKYKNRFMKNDVEIRPIIAGNMTQQPLYKKYVKNRGRHKNADFIHQNGFYFPNNPELTPKELNLLGSLLKK